MTTTTRAGDLIQRWYCSDCQCEHEASVLGGVAVPPLEQLPLLSLKEVESTRVEEEDYEKTKQLTTARHKGTGETSINFAGSDRSRQP